MALNALSKQCEGRNGRCSRPGGGSHVLLEGQLTKDAAIYPRGVCRAMLRGVSQQLKADKVVKEGCLGIQVPDDESEVHESVYGPAQ